jgi:hypothetical protein
MPREAYWWSRMLMVGMTVAIVGGSLIVLLIFTFF